MKEQQLIEINDKILEFIDKKNLREYPQISNKINEINLDKSDVLKKKIKDVSDENRALRVGIIGRVKAGKSSLLNALLFNGRDVLPKAATPMTAALTFMSYSEEIKAEVDLYSKADIEQIKQESQAYERDLQNLTQKHENNIKNEKKPNKLPSTDIKQRAEKIAKEELEGNQSRVAAYQQYTTMQQNSVSQAQLDEMSILKASSIDELMGKLHNYVGAGGTYMPYTKSVKLYLPEKGLKDLEIVDTPGVNDPVVSREERTNEFLSSCDVVLVVSPAGQFLSTEDIDLMTRVSTRDGVQHAYLIASQSDNQLFGSMNENKLDTPTQVLAKIENKLSEVAKKNLQTSVNNHGVLKNVLSMYAKNDVICTSSAAFSMLETFDNQENWDDGYKKVWENLTDNYYDYFDSDQIAKYNLQALANIDKVKTVIDNVRAEKENIQAEKRKALSSTLLSNYRELLEEIELTMENRIFDIESKDIEEERKKLADFESYRKEAQETVTCDYKHSIYQIEHQWYNTLLKILHDQAREFDRQNQTTTETRVGTRTIPRWYWFDKKEKYNYNEETIYAGQVYSCIKEIIKKIEVALNESTADLKEEWDDTLNRQIFSGLKECNNDGARLDRKNTNRIIRGVLHKLPRKKFKVNNTIPKNIRVNRKLSGYEAEEFVENASDYMDNCLINGVEKDIINYVTNTVKTLNTIDLATQINKKIAEDIEKLINDIDNKEMSIKRYKYIEQAAKTIRMEIDCAK